MCSFPYLSKYSYILVFTLCSKCVDGKEKTITSKGGHGSGIQRVVIVLGSNNCFEPWVVQVVSSMAKFNDSIFGGFPPLEKVHLDT